MFRVSQPYNNSTLEQAKLQIMDFRANLGGTDIYTPMREVLHSASLPTHPRSIFLLTDGAVTKPSQVIDLIQGYSYNTRVHTFGMGSGASPYLVTGTAKAGRGVAHMVSDGDSSLT